ncbi:MAG: hypothetical protein M4579_006410 [Chaenotheca gracillima]|nr:MAG: hypothetical protein M4579_006410 [Chaenotheca gracillima]
MKLLLPVLVAAMGLTRSVVLGLPSVNEADQLVPRAEELEMRALLEERQAVYPQVATHTETYSFSSEGVNWDITYDNDIPETTTFNEYCNPTDSCADTATLAQLRDDLAPLTQEQLLAYTKSSLQRLKPRGDYAFDLAVCNVVDEETTLVNSGRTLASQGRITLNIIKGVVAFPILYSINNYVIGSNDTASVRALAATSIVYIIYYGDMAVNALNELVSLDVTSAFLLNLLVHLFLSFISRIIRVVRAGCTLIEDLPQAALALSAHGLASYGIASTQTANDQIADSNV